MFCIKTNDDYLRSDDGKIWLFHYESHAENQMDLSTFIDPTLSPCAVVEITEDEST